MKEEVPSSSMVPMSRRGRLRCAFGPNVLENGSVLTICGRCRSSVPNQELCPPTPPPTFFDEFEVSSSKPIGNLFRFNSTEYGSAFCSLNAVRKWSNAVCEITRVLPIDLHISLVNM